MDPFWTRLIFNSLYLTHIGQGASHWALLQTQSTTNMTVWTKSVLNCIAVFDSERHRYSFPRETVVKLEVEKFPFSDEATMDGRNMGPGWIFLLLSMNQFLFLKDEILVFLSHRLSKSKSPLLMRHSLFESFLTQRQDCMELPII